MKTLGILIVWGFLCGCIGAGIATKLYKARIIEYDKIIFKKIKDDEKATGTHLV
jgi:hypothetical protein